MDAWLVILTIVMIVIMLAVNIYLFVIYCHPDDLTMGTAWFSKIIIVFGYFLVSMFVLILPLDIANSRGDGGGLNIDVLYQILFISTVLCSTIIIPYTLFLYETDDEKPLISRLCSAFFMEIFIVIVVAILALIAFGAMRTASLSELQIQSVANLSASESSTSVANGIVVGDRVIYNVPPFIFLVVFILLIGWFLFVVFGGIGIFALPLDLIIEFFTRPKPRSAREIAERKVALRKTTETLLSYARQVLERSSETENEESDKGLIQRWRDKRSLSKRESKLASEVYKLELEYDIFEAENSLSANPIIDYLKLLLGMIMMLISFIIWLHLIVYVLAVKNGKPAS